MDKEARAWVSALIRDYPKETPDDLNVLVSLISEALEELGYRKPLDRPELRGKIYEILADYAHAREIAFADGISFKFAHYIDQILELIPDVEEIKDRVASQIRQILEDRDWKRTDLILSIPELAVVDREAELPENPFNYEDECREYTAYSKAQQDMLKNKWVKEVKECQR